MNRRTLIATLGVAFTGGCVGGGSNADSEPDTDTETIRTNADAVVVMTNEPAFEPWVVEIATGDTIAWINECPRAQSVTARAKDFPERADYFASGGFERESIASILYPIQGNVKPGESYQHAFETPGVYQYYSIRSEHLGMDGQVVVE